MHVCAGRLLIPGFVMMSMLACSSADTPRSESTTAAAPAAGTAAPPRDACTLITAEEAGKILGSPATATPRSTSSDRSTCDYVTKSFESFTLEAVWRGAEDVLKTARSSAIASTEAAGGSADQTVNEVMGLYRVDNLGDEAYFSRRTMSYVRKGDVVLIFQNAGLNEPAREHWQALARAALARL